MNALLEQLLYGKIVPEPVKDRVDPELFDDMVRKWSNKGISQAPIDKEAKIEFTLSRHADGKYSAKITQVPAEDKEVDDYAKWLAGSFATALASLESIAGVDDPDKIAESKSPVDMSPGM